MNGQTQPCGCLMLPKSGYYDILVVNWFCSVHTLKPVFIGQHG